MTGVNGGSCTIRLTLSKSGYNDKTYDYSFTVVINLKDFQRAKLFNGLVISGSKSRPVFIDISGDGKDDLVLGGADGRFRYFKKETLGYTEQTGADNPFDGFDVGHYSAPAFADVDGDGDIDLISMGITAINKTVFFTSYPWKVFYYKKGDSGYTLQTNPADGSVVNDPFTHINGTSIITGHVYTLSFFNNDSDTDLEVVRLSNDQK